ncbi:MAG TPA: septation ring formation regulator EzrA [Bacilli bacterium]|nr:septation ring formation regulator EzrA [Bacilli bacterium]
MLFPNRHLADLEKRYEHSHALFMSHAHSIIDRLASIANRNILYVPIHDDFATRYDKIKDEYLSSVSQSINSLRTMLDNKNNKGFASLYEPTRVVVTNFEKAVAKLSLDLEKVMKSEEDARGLAFGIKEEVRRLKDNYRVHQTELSLIEKSFDRLFTNIDINLKKVDELIEIADYGEAGMLIAKLKRLARQVEDVIREAPSLCVMIERIIPEKIHSLREESERMVKKQFPIHHLMLNVTIDKIQDELAVLTTQMANLDITGVSEKLRANIGKIEKFYGDFDKEKEAKIQFEKDYQPTYDAVNQIERNFIKLNSTLPQIKQYYVLGAAQSDSIETIRQLISKMNMTKRGLDTLVLSATRQPYSLQVDIIKVLKEENERALKLIAEFNQYLASLKAKSNEAYQLVNTYYVKFKIAEHQLFELDIDAISGELLPKFDDYYHSLTIISETLKVLPIDIGVIETHVDNLKTGGEQLLVRIDKELSTAQLAESAIIHANRDRNRLTDYHRLLSMAEASFLAGSFQQSYLEAGNLLKKINAQLNQK